MKKYVIFMRVLAGVLVFIVGGDIFDAEAAIGEKLVLQEIQRIGGMVFENECVSKDDTLITWNEGENFMSLGIGHFIWYPQKTRG